MTEERCFILGTFVTPNEEEEIICACCDSHNVQLKAYRYPPGHEVSQQMREDDISDQYGEALTHEQVMLLCDFCSSTHCSRAVSDPLNVAGDAHVTQAAVAYSHNLLMVKLEQLTAKVEFLASEILTISAGMQQGVPVAASSVDVARVMSSADGACPNCATKITGTAVECHNCGWNKARCARTSKVRNCGRTLG